MALIRCSECGRQISNRAEFCPQCGAPNGRDRQTRAAPAQRSGCIVGLLKWTFGAIVCLVILGMILPNDPQRVSPPQQVSNSPPKITTTQERKSEPSPIQTPARETKRNYKVAFENFNEQLKALDPTGILFKATKLEPEAGKVIITVYDEWHSLPYQKRLQAVQNLWKIWAVEMGTTNARIRIVDLNGNEVGGSRLLSPDAIWVSEK